MFEQRLGVPVNPATGFGYLPQGTEPPYQVRANDRIGSGSPPDSSCPHIVMEVDELEKNINLLQEALNLTHAKLRGSAENTEGLKAQQANPALNQRLANMNRLLQRALGTVQNILLVLQ